ncbi:hypothetical protein LPW36_01925 [Jinshanibacter sp. LJY008]|uniref:Uncharacterized protein n=1 Tax=Limnobaculum eriocheiris TaxID=2897391 RepID=A0A9X1MU68_9GAMM|nr:hypothetical protein [Limnobaculum eriocheiris]MCD1124802.1 hypothetical protein [Limnobaculum eriocheiris]
MTTTLSVNSNNDIFIANNGRLAISNDLAAVMTIAEQAVKAQAGEMIYATDKGMPTLSLIWTGTPNLQMYEGYLRSTLMSVKGVSKVLSVSMGIQDGTLSYSAQIETIYGSEILNGEL